VVPGERVDGDPLPFSVRFCSEQFCPVLLRPQQTQSNEMENMPMRIEAKTRSGLHDRLTMLVMRHASPPITPRMLKKRVDSRLSSIS